MAGDTTESREHAVRLESFRSLIGGFADAAWSARQVEHDPDKFQPYDATIAELHGRTEHLGEREMELWDMFINFIRGINESSFEAKKPEASRLIDKIVEERAQHSGTQEKNKDLISDARHEFYGWLINVASALALMQYAEDYKEYERDNLIPLKDKLGING